MNGAGARTTVIGRVGATVFFLFFLGMGLLFTGLMGWGAWQQVEPMFWRETAATVLEVEVREEGNSYAPAVRYRYWADGRERESTVFEQPRSSSENADSQRARLEGLEVDQPTTCRVDPRDPDRAVLRVGFPWLVPFLALPLIFVAVGAGGIYATWRRPGPEGDSGTAKTPGRNRGTLVGAVFVIIGLGTTGAMAPSAWRAFSSAQWVETPAVVIASRVQAKSGDKGRTYRPDIRYRYWFAGREYESNRYTSVTVSTGDAAGSEALVRAHPPGREIVCFVNPAKPSEAVLRRGVGWEAAFGLIPLVFVGLGGVVFFVARRSPDATARARPVAAEVIVEEGVPVLRPASNPTSRLLVAGAVAVFWNGIVAVFAVEAVNSFRRGDPEWLLIVFLTPFLLIGIALLAGVGYHLLALTNPKCRLSVNSPRLAPGEPLEVSWVFTGSTARLRRLVIYVEGTEEATYRRGTRNTTDREVFARFPVAEIPGGIECAQGRAGVLVPDDAMPSFAAEHNKITWTLRVLGEIDHWPAIREEYAIVIEPREVTP